MRSSKHLSKKRPRRGGRSIEGSMTHISQPSAAGKHFVDTRAERDLLLASLRVAAARAKLNSTFLKA